MKLFILSWMLIFLALGIHPVTVFCAEESKPEQQVEMVFRSYDLSFFQIPNYWETSEEMKNLPILPFHHYSKALHGVYEKESSQISYEEFYEMVYRFVGEEQFEYDGSSIHLIEEHLLVRAPEAVHRKIAAIIGFLKSHLHRRVALKCDLFEWTGAEQAGVLEPEEIQRALEQGQGPFRRIFSRSVEVRAGELFEINEGDRTSILIDYEPEIAESSVVSEALLTPLFTGIHLAIRPLPSLDGKSLSVGLFGSMSGFTEPLEFRNIQCYGALTMEQNRQKIAAGTKISDPKISFASAATLVDVHPDSPVLVVSRFPHHAGTGALVIRLSGRLLPVPDKVELEEGRVLACWDLGYAQMHRLLPVRIDRKAFNPWALEEIGGDLFSFFASTSLGPSGRLDAEEDRIQNCIDVLWNEETIPEEYAEELEEGVTFYRMEDFLFLCSSPGLHRNLAGRINEHLNGKTSTIDACLRFVEADGPAVLTEARDILDRGRVTGMMDLPIRSGMRAMAAAGFQGLMVVNYDVDVAKQCTIANPNTASYLDGAYAHFRHESSMNPGEADSLLRVVIYLNRLNRFESLNDYGGHDSVLGVIDRPVFETSFIDTRIKTDGNPVVLGSVSGKREGKLRTMYVIGEARTR